MPADKTAKDPFAPTRLPAPETLPSAHDRIKLLTKTEKKN